MSKESSGAATGGTSILTVLLVVFVVLKLTDNIDWGWMWVLSPFWIPLGALVGVIGVIITVGLMASVFGSIKRKRNLSKQYKEHRDASK
jgi:hypothetical protein